MSMKGRKKGKGSRKGGSQGSRGTSKGGSRGASKSSRSSKMSSIPRSENTESSIPIHSALSNQSKMTNKRLTNI